MWQYFDKLQCICKIENTLNTMKKALPCFLFLLVYVVPIFSQEIIRTTGDSLSFLNAKDTIIISLDEFRQKKIKHHIAKGQTVYSIAKFYGMSAEELMDFNPTLNESSLAIGTSLEIPIPLKAIRTKDFQWKHRMNFAPVFYEVSKSETMYTIAKKYFKMDVELLRERNGLENYNLSVGQYLLIGWLRTDGISEKLREKAISKWERSNLVYKKIFLRESRIKKSKTDIGMAQWLAKKGTSKTSYYAMHNKAPMNSIIRVTNNLTNRIIYAKVIGRIPRQRYDSRVKVVVSANAAKILNAIDSKFYVEVEYH